jgi:hypothetical protein
MVTGGIERSGASPLLIQDELDLSAGYRTPMKAWLSMDCIDQAGARRKGGFTGVAR